MAQVKHPARSADDAGQDALNCMATIGLERRLQPEAAAWAFFPTKVGTPLYRKIY
jgi:hypothetical protein